MPEPKDGETKDDFLARCIPIVVEDGTAENNEQAVAICMNMWDQKSLMVTPTFSEIKVLEDNKIGGYLIRFSTADTPDLAGDFFTAATEFGSNQTPPLFYNHGLDPKMKSRIIGHGEIRKDEVGLWYEAQLTMRDAYEKYLMQLIKQGKMGFSSGSLAHLVDREPQQNASWVRTWIIGEASLTPTPAEYRNVVSELKTMDVSGDDVFSNVELDDSQGSDLSQESTVDKENASTLVSGSNEEIKSKEAEMPENDQVQQVLQVLEELRTEISNIKSTLPTVNTPVDVNVVKDEADQKFESFGQFLTAVKMAEIRPQDLDPRLKSREVKASGMSEAIPADGGYLLENSYAAGILEKMHPVGSLLSMVARDEIGANSNSMTYHGNDESSRADGSRWGGVRGYWLAEAGQKTSSQPKFKDITLKLKKVAALCYATDELLEDSTALQSWLTRVVPSELKFKAEDAIINGDGAGKPLGIMNAPCLISVSAETGQAATTIVYENIIKMWARRWAGVSDYVWLINQDTTPQLDTLVLAAGTAGIPPNFVTYGADGVMRIKGRPVIEVEYCATLGTVGDILLISPSQYQTIGKGGIAAASSIHVKFDYDETAFRFVYRMDGQPAWESALTPFKGSNTQSPFVALATRS